MVLSLLTQTVLCCSCSHTLPVCGKVFPTPGSHLDFEWQRQLLSVKTHIYSVPCRCWQREHLVVWKQGVSELNPKLQNVREFLTGFERTARELQFYARDTQPTFERYSLTKHQTASFPLKGAKTITHKIPWILEYSLKTSLINTLPSGQDLCTAQNLEQKKRDIKLHLFCRK